MIYNQLRDIAKANGESRDYGQQDGRENGDESRDHRPFLKGAC